jgi:hypothetical protein
MEQNEKNRYFLSFSFKFFRQAGGYLSLYMEHTDSIDKGDVECGIWVVKNVGDQQFLWLPQNFKWKMGN